MKNKRKINWTHTAEFILAALSFIIIVWAFISFIDINLHNDYFSTHFVYGDYAKWNLFMLLFK